MKFIKDDINIDFIGKRKMAFIFSISLIIIGMIVVSIRGKENLGIDFTGGLLQQIEFEKELTVSEVRTALQNSTSIASLLVTTEAMIAEKPEKEKLPAMPPGGGYPPPEY